MISFILYIVFAAAVGYWASHRGRSAILWAIIALVISPIFAAIILAVMKDLSVQQELERSRMENGMLKDRVAASEADIHSRMDHMERRIDHLEGKEEPEEVAAAERESLPAGRQPRFCPHCGAKLGDGCGPYCPVCGEKLF